MNVNLFIENTLRIFWDIYIYRSHWNAVYWHESEDSFLVMNYTCTCIDVYNFPTQLTTGNASAAPRIND